MFFYWVIMNSTSLLSIIDGNAKRELGLLSFGIKSWCTQGVCSNVSMKFFGFLIWFLVEEFIHKGNLQAKYFFLNLI